VKINTTLLPCEKVGQNFGLLLLYIKLPKENTRPIGEYSPNLVTLAESLVRTTVSKNTRTKTAPMGSPMKKLARDVDVLMTVTRFNVEAQLIESKKY
jgi:hypothetical protein